MRLNLSNENKWVLFESQKVQALVTHRRRRGSQKTWASPENTTCFLYSSPVCACACVHTLLATGTLTPGRCSTFILYPGWSYSYYLRGNNCSLLSEPHIATLCSNLTLVKHGLNTPNSLITNNTLKKKFTFFWAKQMRKKTLNSYWLCKHQLIKQKRHQS